MSPPNDRSGRRRFGGNDDDLPRVPRRDDRSFPRGRRDAGRPPARSTRREPPLFQRDEERRGPGPGRGDRDRDRRGPAIPRRGEDERRGPPPRPVGDDRVPVSGDGDAGRGAQRRAFPGGGTPRGQRPGQGAPPTGGGKERRRERPERPAPPVLAAPGNDLLYGRNAVAEALRGGRRALRLYLAEGAREDERIRAILAAAAERGAAVDRIPRLLLDDLFRGSNHQGIALEAGSYRYAPLPELLEAPGVVLVLDHLQDPQNFGTLLRAAEAAGVAGVVIPQDRAVEVTPSVVNASSGAVELLRVARVPNLSRALEAIKGSGRWVIGLDDAPGAVDLYAADLPTPAALVVGAEGSGISAGVRKGCDLLVRLPMRGRIASLNAATAGAIALYELLRREPAGEPGGRETG